NDSTPMIVRIARVKVGHRQAPQQQPEPHPITVGFRRLRAPGTGVKNTPPVSLSRNQHISIGQRALLFPKQRSHHNAAAHAQQAAHPKFRINA
ncbi:MAG TPA: hypothetical protein VEN30_31645, partial [Paraburkholderia sp.]|nr:hypothetical protein [Paraburkholderia sp.]